MRYETVKFGDTGDHWTIQAYLTVAQEREWFPKLFSFLQVEGQEVRVDLTRPAELEDVSDQFMLAITGGWSYGGSKLKRLLRRGKPDLATLRLVVPSHHYSLMTEKVMDLYRPLVERNAEASAKLFSSLSSESTR